MLRKLFVLYTGAWLAGSRFYRQGRHSGVAQNGLGGGWVTEVSKQRGRIYPHPSAAARGLWGRSQSLKRDLFASGRLSYSLEAGCLSDSDGGAYLRHSSGPVRVTQTACSNHPNGPV